MTELNNYDYILNDFYEILDNFKIESQKPFKGNEFAAKIRNDMDQDFNTFIKSIVSDKDKYESKFSPGMNNWFKDLWVGFYNEDVTESGQTGIYLIFLFEADGSGLSLSLVQGVNESKKFIIQRADYLRRIIEEHPLDVPDGFSHDENAPDCIIRKFYKKEDLNIDSIVADLKGIIEVYEYLIPYYVDYRMDEEPAKKDLRPENSGIMIWRIAPGESEISNEAWKEFKQESYIGVGFNYGDVDYTTFKNKWAMDKYLDGAGVKAPSKSMLWKFVNWIRKGDIVIVNKGRSKFAGIGVIDGSFIPSTKNENKNDYDLNNIYPVKWLHTPDDLEFPKNFFARHTLIEWDNEKWNKFLCIIAKNNRELKEKILKNLYEESYKILFIDNEWHLEKYKKEHEEINVVWNEILEKYNNNEPIHEDVWEKLLHREIKVHIDAVYNIKSALKLQLDLSDEDMENTANLLFETLLRLKDNEDVEDQKKIIKEYSESKYSKGIGIGRFSSILYYLDNQYYVINKKTIETVKLLSLLLGDEIVINKSLSDYIDENKRYHEFLDKLRNAYLYDKFDIGDFVFFDAICHYICSESSINYIGKNAERIPIEYYVSFEENSQDEDMDEDEDFDDEHLDPESDEEFESKFDLLYLTPELLESKLQSFSISNSTLNQLCASLNAGKNIILDGTPGTGKTELAIKFSTAASDNNFIDGYILTTATSDWSTFDTIGGLMPNEKGELFFYPGKFLDAIAENKWLIIDEINRADIDKAFGQLFTVLSKQDVELPYKENDKPIKIKLWDENYSKHDEEKAIYYIGNNWRIIGTMNVDDKDSLFDLSYAFMRRFMFIEVDLPEEEDYKNLIRMWSNDLSEEYALKLLRVYDVIKFRKLGPAIFKDMTEYIKFRDEISGDSTDLILAEAISSYIVPQFEGLNRNKVEQIRKLIGDIGLSQYLDEELVGLIPKF